MIKYERVTECAKSWMGTPFHPQARKKHMGCDCLGLILGIASELSAVSFQDKKSLPAGPYDAYDYVRDSWMLKEEFKKHFIQANPDIHLGAILLLEFPRLNRMHLAIVTEMSPDLDGDIKASNDCIDLWYKRVFRIIHSCVNTGYVVEQTIPVIWRRAVVRTFDFCFF